LTVRDEQGQSPLTGLPRLRPYVPSALSLVEATGSGYRELTRQPNKDAPFFRRRRAAEARQTADKERLQEERRAAAEHAKTERERLAELVRRRQDWLFAQAKDRLAAANAAIGTTRTFFFALLSVAAYIGVVIASTTDEQLLRDSPVKLPIIGVEVPLTGFYLFVPWLFVLLHLNLLIHLGLTSRKLKTFLDAIEPLEPQLSRRLQNDVAIFPLAQWMIGHNDRMLHFFLSLIVVILLVFIPPFLLLWMQVRFLAFQGELISWLQAVAVITDAVMIFLLLLWFSIYIQTLLRRRGITEEGKIRQAPGVAIASNVTIWVVVLVPLVLAACSALHLRNRLLELLATDQSRNTFCTNVVGIPMYSGWEESLNQWLCGQYQLFFAEGVGTRNPITGRTVNALRGDDHGAREKALNAVLGLRLIRRNLKWAKLWDAVLPKADFRIAQLQGADLSGAQLQGANLAQAQLAGADLSGAQLQGANLVLAQLAGADLSGAQLQGANLARAQLAGADLVDARLQDALLWKAQAPGANLSRASFHGANLSEARLDGAILQQANLEDADLRTTQLAGTRLLLAQLVGTNLWKARLEDAQLVFVQLRGANLEKAELRGADLAYSSIEWTNLTDADLSFANLEGVKNLDTAELAGADYAFADGLEGTILDINQPPPDVLPAP